MQTKEQENTTQNSGLVEQDFSDWSTLNPEKFIKNDANYSRLMMKYRCAIREVKTKLEVLSDEFSMAYNRNPIDSIHTRIKSPESIYRKLQKMGHEFTAGNIEQYLNDVSGIRVICPFINDIYTVANLLAQQDDIEVLQIKDYIKNPKPNGYRSYHMIVQIPVFFSKGKTPMRVEVQIRTIAMNFWASLEHQIRYKKNLENTVGLDLNLIEQELQKAAQNITELDEHMQSIKNMIGKFNSID